MSICPILIGQVFDSLDKRVKKIIYFDVTAQSLEAMTIKEGFKDIYFQCIYHILPLHE